ncbi:WD40-repeat-containing domain protein [Catenaria anguillulae PL171]|uniref:WD40-repeat-containing domain protein n=1 Tax=Catenaria anguillulae PL171 TaxID=765915 RepID=A0A1Y2HJW9_9FUNG|nr:WD40-repeat-containing domain protein [Catenaria anguillulae PL171]
MMMSTTNTTTAAITTTFLPTVTVQHDWPQVVADVAASGAGHKEAFWISLYPTSPSLPSLHGSIVVANKHDTFPVHVSGGHEFDAKLIHHNVDANAPPAQDRPNPAHYAPGAIKAQVTIREEQHPWPPITLTIHPPRLTVTAVRPALEGKKDVDARELRTKPLSINSVDTSPSGELIAYGADNGIIRIIDTEDGALRRTLHGHVGDVLRVRFFPSGQVLLSTSNDLTARIWSVLDGSCPRTLKGHRRAITDCAMLGRGKSVITASRDCTARIWLCSSGECTSTINLDHPINQLDLLDVQQYNPSEFPQWHEFASDDERYIGVFALHSGHVVGVHLSTKHVQFSLAYPHAANSVAVVSERLVVAGYEDGSVIAWDPKMGRKVRHIQVFKTAVTRVRGLPGDSVTAAATPTRVLVTSADGLVQIVAWNENECWIPDVLTGGDMEPVYAVNMASTGVVVTAGRDGIVRVYRKME